MRDRLRLIVASVIVLASLAGAMVYLVPRLADGEERPMRIAVPSIAQFGLARPGVYTIYHEKQAMVDGVYYASDTVAGLKLVVTSMATGTEVRLVEPGTTAALMSGDNTGTPIYTFTVDQPGRYRLVASLPNAAAAPQIALSIGYDRLGSVLSTTGGAVAAIVAAAGLLGALVLASRWRRSKAGARSTPAIERAKPRG